MADPGHERLRRLFDCALELPVAARAAFVDAECGDDAELKRRLVAMLAAAEDEPFLAAPTGSSRETSVAPLREGPGTRIGPYELLQLIGEGGFGAVFLAEQEKPVARRVALKIIKLGMDTRQVVARFEQERQALALMDHPNIARVIDAGATDTGRPYFVMDLVKGDPIAQYCDKNQLTIDERLELFAQVCNAVQHAHQKGIIHRDIKPSNVLVSTQDGKPLAKVIDFGIAKATSSKLTDKTLFTEHQQIIGTLQYMSPEQAAGSLDIDTRTDVYSLGVLLYELLTGSTPFDKNTIRDALFSEIHRMIREVEPPKPSTRLSQSAAEIASIAAQRGVEPKRLGSIVRGELDWIVMKALEKDRARRYETANGLAMDIARYLGGEPVVAAPPSAVYRLRKFVRRHKATVAAGSAVAVALLIGVIAFAWQADVARGERDAAVKSKAAEEQARRTAQTLGESEAKQRVIAESNEKKAAAINQFLLEMLGSADIRALGRSAKLSQALTRATAGVGPAFRDRPDVEAAVRLILGKTYLSIGMLDDAGPQLETALELNRRVHGTESEAFVDCLNNLGTYEQSRGKLEPGAEMLRRALEISTRVRGANRKGTLALKCDYANALVLVNRGDEAEKLLREAIAAETREFGRDTPNAQVMLSSLAVLLDSRGQLEEAEALCRESLAVGTRVLGPEHPDTLTTQMNLASFLHRRNSDAEAEPLMAGTFADTERVFGDSHPQTAGAALMLGRLYGDLGRYPDALPLLEEALAIRRRAEGDFSAGAADAKQTLALMLSKMGEFERAMATQRDVVRTNVALFGDESAATLQARITLTNILANGANGSEAEAEFRELVPTCSRALGEEHAVTVIAINSLGVLLMNRSRYAEAEPYVRKALEAGRRSVGADNADTIVTLINLFSIERFLNRFDQAEPLGREAVERTMRVLGPKHATTAVARGDYGMVLGRLGRNDDARVELAAAVAVSKAAWGEKDPHFCLYGHNLGRLLLDAGKADEAEPVLRDVAEVSAQARGERDFRTALARLDLGRSCQALRRFTEAEPLLVGSHEALVAARPAGHADIGKAERALADLYAAWNAAEPDPTRAAKAAEWKAKADAKR